MDLPNFAETKWKSDLQWRLIGDSDDVPLIPETGSSSMFLYGDTQIAVYRFPDNRLFASQNMCGHRLAFILSEGTMETDNQGDACISCPMHRRKFALEGSNAGYTSSRNFKHTIAVFEVKEEGEKIYVKLPDTDELDAVLGTRKWANSSRPKPSFLRNLGDSHRAVPLLDDGSPKCAAGDSQLTW